MASDSFADYITSHCCFAAASTKSDGHTPKESESLHKYPVVVFIHGESYEWNSGNPYDGSVLAAYARLVVVTVNFRLGILGFLNPSSQPSRQAQQRAPSNYGLMDQLAALHWLQENIHAFGGDPRQVTLMGHGTGAACVHFLMTSSAVPDGILFNRAIMMSGSGLSPWSLVRDPASHAENVARNANCSFSLSPQDLLKCLRDRPLEVILKPQTDDDAFKFSYEFGPSVDGVVIDTGDSNNQDSSNSESGSVYTSANGASTYNMVNTINNVLLRKDAINKLTRYDLLLGVTRAEAYFSFSGDDAQYGIEPERRNKILKSFVSQAYTYHLAEILATVINEYTDWERPVQHPINIRDETLEALSDAQVVAPATRTADLHSQDHRNSYLYVFDYQTRAGDYPQRQGCIHGEDLPYVFGAPLVSNLGHFAKNFTKAESLLSETVMLYWSNFARTGNPNEAPDPADAALAAKAERSRARNIEWTAYESVHKKYLNIDTKPKLKNHYRAHRLSFWLNLIPDLHKPGGDDVPPSHHQLILDENNQGSSAGGPQVTPGRPTATQNTGSAAKADNSDNTEILPGSRDNEIGSTIIGLKNITNIGNYGNAGINVGGSQNGLSDDGFAAYSTALSVTIAVGCSLLILNVLVFAGVYYQRDKTRLHDARQRRDTGNAKKRQRQENGTLANSICGELMLSSDPGHHGHPGDTAMITLTSKPPPPPGSVGVVGLTRLDELELRHHHNNAMLNNRKVEYGGTMPRNPPPPPQRGGTLGRMPKHQQDELRV
ncbi:neuroligin-4, Y-linked-like [Ctenocephalides felis]|uniref:neuroligin-4, Y-linked-like n=1 Tax=Ctenocephalides felis TaxID=7515 RepID=UPI000E6E348D|nr:neuroligin-4, Y-linked-like [Ctenocephalides felis]